MFFLFTVISKRLLMVYEFDRRLLKTMEVAVLKTTIQIRVSGVYSHYPWSSRCDFLVY